MDTDAKVKEIIIDKLGVEESQITPEASFTNDLGADSLDIVQILVAVEDTYDIEIPDEELEDVTDMESFVSVIERIVAEKD